MTAWLATHETAGAVLFLAFGYFLGAIPFGLVFTRAAGLGDVRKVGSGNIGATNVLRTGRKGLALATLLADAGKGAAAVLIARMAGGETMAFAAGLGAFLGHLFPVYLKFAGGKGVATYIGVIAALYWPAALIFCGIWLAVALVTRYSSAAALVSAFATPLVLLLLSQPNLAALTALLSLLLIAKHHKNIRNLLSGNESKIGQRAA